MNVNKMLSILNFLDIFNLSFLKIFLRKYIVKSLLIIKNDLIKNKDNNKMLKALIVSITFIIFMLNK